MGKRILAIAIASVLALLGALLVFLYARNADVRALEGQQPQTVYLSLKPVPAGTTLKDAVRTQLIEKTQLAAKGVPVGALQAIDEKNDQLLAITEVPAGQYLLTSMFGKTPTGSKAIEIAPGRVAVSVQLSDPARVGTFVTPGSRIAIFATASLKKYDTSPDTEKFNALGLKGTVVLLDDVRVIAMGATPLSAPAASTANANGAQPQQNQPSFLVTVEVTPEQATKLIHGINNYTLYAALRGSDLQIPPGFEVDDRNVLSQ
jgi:pilus assembly protein CpaB